jgi:hypothetical protein
MVFLFQVSAKALGITATVARLKHAIAASDLQLFMKFLLH